MWCEAAALNSEDVRPVSKLIMSYMMKSLSFSILAALVMPTCKATYFTVVAFLVTVVSA